MDESWGKNILLNKHGYGWVRFSQRSLGMSGKEATPEPVFLVSWGPAGRRCLLCLLCLLCLHGLGQAWGHFLGSHERDTVSALDVLTPSSQQPWEVGSTGLQLLMANPKSNNL